MQYLCLVYEDEARLSRLHEDERQELVDECCAYIQELRSRDQLLALSESSVPIRVWVRDGSLCVDDGELPDVDTRLGKCVMIEARDLNDAIRIAGRTPMARYGYVEVRPLQNLEQVRE